MISMAVDDVTKVHCAIYNGFAKVGAQIGSTIKHVKNATVGWLFNGKTTDSVKIHERASDIIQSGFGKIKEAAKYTAGFAKKVALNVKDGAKYIKDGAKLVCDVAKGPENYVKNLASKAGGEIVSDFFVQHKSKIASVFMKIAIAIVATSIVSFLLGPLITFLISLATTIALVVLFVNVAKKIKEMQI